MKLLFLNSLISFKAMLIIFRKAASSGQSSRYCALMLSTDAQLHAAHLCSCACACAGVRVRGVGEPFNYPHPFFNPFFHSPLHSPSFLLWIQSPILTLLRFFCIPFLNHHLWASGYSLKSPSNPYWLPLPCVAASFKKFDELF